MSDDSEYQERIRLARVAAGSWKSAPAPAPAQVDITDEAVEVCRVLATRIG